MNQSSDEASETIRLVDWTIGQTEKRKRTGEIAHLEKAEVLQKSESRAEEKIDIGGIVVRSCIHMKTEVLQATLQLR